MKNPTNELTFVAWLGTATRLRAESRATQGLPTLIFTGEIEERQLDSLGAVKRCDLRLNSRSGAKLISGEVKRPEVPEGRDARNERLREDARKKAIARGLPFYFTCNMREVVLYAIGSRATTSDREEFSTILCQISHSSEVDAHRSEIESQWSSFIDDVEERLRSQSTARPIVTAADVIAVRNAIYAVADECLVRSMRRLDSDEAYAQSVRAVAEAAFNFSPPLQSSLASNFRAEVEQLLRFGVFVFAQKLLLYRVLEEAGGRRRNRFGLDRLAVPHTSTDPSAIEALLKSAVAQAIERSGDFETAFLPEPLSDLVFTRPSTPQEVLDCRVGLVWYRLLEAIEAASWTSISQNLLGLLYELLVDPKFRHDLGQFYTREDVVDLLVTFAIQSPADLTIDPAAGGGSFLRSAYNRKRAIGADHNGALSTIWGVEITAFAAELSTVTLATSDPVEETAYPRVVLSDFFALSPGKATRLEIPGQPGRLTVPRDFDAVVGNPPYISYRRQSNQKTVIRAFAKLPESVLLPRFSGKSDAYVWFIVHATQFLKEGGRLGFVVSSAVLFADYGIPLIRFVSRHYRIVAVIDSLVERWFPDADTNAVLLLLERCSSATTREENQMRFIRLRRPLAQLFPAVGQSARRDELENLIAELLDAPHGGGDPRFSVNIVRQGFHGGIEFDGDPDQVESEDLDQPD
ncbi:MAG: N-6 DNA methylase [Bauldia sp.]|nr:N-6 DNA methylase [Bauldia sp.]